MVENINHSCTFHIQTAQAYLRSSQVPTVYDILLFAKRP